MLRKKGMIIVVALDADGCAYHYLVDFLQSVLFSQFAKEINALEESVTPAFIDAFLAAAENKLNDHLHLPSDEMKRLKAVYDGNILAAGHQRIGDVNADDDKIYHAQCSHYLSIIKEKLPLVLNKIFVMANANLIQYILSKVNAGDTLLIATASNRLDKYKDNLSMFVNITHSFFHDLTYFAEHLRGLLHDRQINVGMHPFTLTDIHADLEIGENFLVALSDKGLEKYPRCVFDKNKIALLLSISQNIAYCYPQDEIQLLYFDDDDKIRKSVEYVFDEFDKLVPRQVTLMSHRCLGVVEKPLLFPGNGDIDRHYRHDIAYLLDLARYASPLYNPTETAIDVRHVVDFNEFQAYCEVINGASHTSEELSRSAIYNDQFTAFLSQLMLEHGASISEFFYSIHTKERRTLAHQLAENIFASIDSIDLQQLDTTLFANLVKRVQFVVTHFHTYFDEISTKLIPAILYRVHQQKFTDFAATAKKQGNHIIYLQPLLAPTSDITPNKTIRDLHWLTQKLNATFRDVTFVLDRCFYQKPLIHHAMTKNHVVEGHQPNLPLRRGSLEAARLHNLVLFSTPQPARSLNSLEPIPEEESEDEDQIPISSCNK